MLFHHLVVNTKQQERRSPLTNEQRLVLPAHSLKCCRNCHRRQRQRKKRARWHFGRGVLDSCSKLVLLRLTPTHSIICHKQTSPWRYFSSPPLGCSDVLSSGLE